MAARLRPARRDYGARRCLSPKTKALASRGFARCKTSAIVAATVQLSVASELAGAARTCAPETGRPRWKNQISPRPRRWTSRPAVSGSPVLPWNWPSFRSVPAPGTQRNWHGAIATVPGGCDAVTDPAKFCSGSAHGVGMTERWRLRCSCLRAWAAGLLPRHSHNTYCVFGR